MAIRDLFSRKDKRKNGSFKSSAPSDQDAESQDSEYVLAEVTSRTSVYEGPAAASSSKLKLAFRRHGKLSAPSETFVHSSERPAYSTVRSEPDHHQLRPPPAKNSLFAAYGEPMSAHSTRSLPTDPIHPSIRELRPSISLDIQPNIDCAPPPPPKKSTGLFAWAHRERKKSKPSAPPTSDPPSAESFNLRSFRHIQPVSPTPGGSRPASPLMPPQPAISRPPRRDSLASDTSQRISVAAFREMHARRSAANSPSPSLRPLSRTEPIEPVRPPDPPSFPSNVRRSTFPLSAQSTSSESEDSGSSETGGSATVRPARKASIKPRSPAMAASSSEMGHRLRPTHRPTNSASAQPASAEASERGSVYSRQRASMSTSALQPNAAAKRASMHVSQQTSNSRRPLSSESGESDSDSDDSDNMPLAKMAIPKRPGSSASNATSSSRPRMPAKPLIDISKMEKTPSLPPVPDKVPDVIPPLPSSKPVEKPSVTDRLTRLAQNAASRSTEYLNIRDSPLPRPSRSQTAPMDSIQPTPSPSPTQARSTHNRSVSSSDVIPDSKATSDPNPIIPTPIRERASPPAFSVTSRPLSQLSLTTSTQLNDVQSTIRAIGSISPTFTSSSSTTSTQTPSSVPAKTSPTSRQRSSTLIPDSRFDSSQGFTGGGLLGKMSASNTEEDASPSRSSALIRPTRPRSSTTTPRTESGSPSTRPFIRPPQSGNNSPSHSQPDIPKLTTPSASSSPRHLPSSFRQQSSFVASPTPSSSGGMPPKPFRGRMGLRGNSPASSTGDSSGGRTPLTPRDGSELGSDKLDRDNISTSASGLSAASGENPNRGPFAQNIRKGHRKSSSMNLDEPERGRSGGRDHEREGPDAEEIRRLDRRRNEAKASIEFGNVVNGRGPIMDDDDDDIQLSAMPPRMSMVNPTMAMGMSMSAPSVTPSQMGWQQPMMSPQPFMLPMAPNNANPQFLMAHQQAMMAAKHAYQVAVAQQALAAANEEWERGSSATSAFGGFGGGMGGLYAGYGMGMQPGWSGPMMFPTGAQSMYAGSVAGGSELGVDNGWGSRSVYGDGTGGYGGRPGDRTSMFRQNGFNSGRSDVGAPAGGQTLRPGVRPRTKTAPSDAPLPPQHSARMPRQAPPSSWKKTPPGQR